MRPSEALEILRLVRTLRAGARMPPERLRALQDRQLRSAVAHAYAEIPFYRELWSKHGVEPADIRGVDDLDRLPVVSAADARAGAAHGRLLSRRVRTANQPVLYTSGSSGAAIAYSCGPGDRWLWWALGMRTSLEHGIRGRERTLRFDPHPGLPRPFGGLGVSRTTWASSDLPDGELLAHFAETQAAVVVATPTSLRQLCRAITAAGISVPKPRAVFAEGEILDGATRDTVRTTVGVDPVSVYGLTEVGYVAWQCERREEFHVNAEAYVAEVLADGRPAAAGELGALVVTDLRGRERPLLRYETGDLAIAGDGGCPCGRSLPLVASIEGRATDSVHLAGGRIVSTRAIVDGLSGVVSPGQYRLHQQAPDRFRVTLATPAVRDAVLPVLRSLLGEVELHFETELRPSRPGAHKTQVVSSTVQLGIGDGTPTPTGAL
jgi:phenylacetate-CoA ligase